MIHNAGDTVRIRSKEWIDGQKKNSYGNIDLGGYVFNPDMQYYAGRIFTIKIVFAGGSYRLVGLGYIWEDWMFDPDYIPDEPISTKDAIRAMLDGERLYDKEGHWAAFNEEKDCFEHEGFEGNIIKSEAKGFSRRLPKRKRPMTKNEMIAWVKSDKSLGWMVRCEEVCWKFPRENTYNFDVDQYQRARLLPDLSGIDESTIQGFEVEE